jgi:hypothetical protein
VTTFLLLPDTVLTKKASLKSFTKKQRELIQFDYDMVMEY